MKKYLIAFLIFALLMATVVTVHATESAEEYGPEPDTSQVVAEGEAATDILTQEPSSEDWFSQAQAWISEHFSGVVVALSALYAVLPKVGGISLILKYLDKIVALFTALKGYIADEKNENSIYNVLKKQGDVQSQFMNDMAPVLEELQADKAETLKLEARLQDAMAQLEHQKGVLLAVEEAVELMAKEFAQLISISTTVSRRTKDAMEEDFVQAKEHLHAAVREALNDGQSKEETA